MPIHLGGSAASALKVGANPVVRAYLGNSLMFGASPSAGVQVIETKRWWTGANITTGPASLTLTTTPQPGDVLFVHYVCIRQSSVRVISTISGCGATWANFWNGTSPSIWKGTAPTTAGSVVISQNSPAPMDAVLYLVRGLDPATGVLASSTAGSASRDQISVGELVLASHHSVNNSTNQMTWPEPRLPASGWVDLGLKWDSTYLGAAGFCYRIPTETVDTTHQVTSSAPIGGLSHNSLVAID